MSLCRHCARDGNPEARFSCRKCEIGTQTSHFPDAPFDCRGCTDSSPDIAGEESRPFTGHLLWTLSGDLAIGNTRDDSSEEDPGFTTQLPDFTTGQDFTTRRSRPCGVACRERRTNFPTTFFTTRRSRRRSRRTTLPSDFTTQQDFTTRFNRG